MERRRAMRAYLRLLLFPVMLGAAVAGWAAEPLLAAYQSQASAAEDRILGTWVLNLAKSKFRPGPPPKSQKRIYEAHRDGVKTTIITVYADGRSTSIEYAANYDGVEYPVTGAPDSDAIALKRIDANTAESTLGHGGKVMAIARRVVSEDGKTLTITYRGMWDGEQSNNVAVYDKVP
jgi:hypothetical protein